MYNMDEENKLSIKEPENIDIQNYRNTLMQKYKNDEDVEKLTNLINVKDTNSILIFGKDASESLSKIADSLLSSVRTGDIEESSELIIQLSKLMDKFNIEDFKKSKEPNFLEKIFNKVQNSIESMLKKYDTMGSEVEKIAVELKKYESDIIKSNNDLNKLFEANLDYYDDLGRYICAGEMALDELDNTHIPMYKENAERSADQVQILEYQQLMQVRDMLQQRIYDLQLAENLALQTIPMIRGIQYGNYNLIRKINSAFIITLPIFKRCLVQAIYLKKQQLQTKSLQELDKRTNELISKNADAVMNQTMMITKMVGAGAIDIDNLEKSSNTIINGIKETSNILKENRNSIDKNTLKIQEINKKLQAEAICSSI